MVLARYFSVSRVLRSSEMERGWIEGRLGSRRTLMVEDLEKDRQECGQWTVYVPQYHWNCCRDSVISSLDCLHHSANDPDKF
jgi:hypothetical protein